MKVLFAVSNEEISESIVKKYQKEYKQIISYKNVYYFNAILKELQKDKSYDRVVISEDVEAFTHTQYDQIDKFIFDKLDSISDEASNLSGRDIPIILICSDRRTQSEEMLVKLFGIGIYNALIGNDRSVDKVCKLINRPRSKKDAKNYYRIESEDIKYRSENENDVSEVEIQNILAHYKRLGKNEDRYIESFNNIAEQYNDTQLRIISKFLPLNVRAVLEESSPKYQQIMSFNNKVSDKLRKLENDEKGTSEKLLTSKINEKIISKPVVIPSSINMNGIKKLARTKNPMQSLDSNMEETQEPETLMKQEPETLMEQFEEIELPEIDDELKTKDIKPIKRGRGRPRKNPVQEQPANQVKRGRGRPRKNPVEQGEEDILQSLPLDQNFEDFKEEDTEILLPGLEKNQGYEEYEDILPGLNTNTIKNEEEEKFLPGLSLESNQDDKETILPHDKTEEILPELLTTTSELDNNYSNISENEYNKIYDSIDLSYLITPDKKIVTFLGTSKNGTSFIVNNLAQLISSLGVNTAILDTTKNRNSYYIYTKNEEELRNIATHSIENLANGIANGIHVNKNLTVYTSLPNEGEEIKNVDKILETLLKQHSLILIDTDFETPVNYFKQSQETYLVQTLDILTIQPLTAFLRELKAKNILEEKKLRVVLNKTVKIKGINEKTIIGGMAYYNDPAMSFMTELFDRSLMKYISIPFEEETYIKYLENIIECNISLKGYSKVFMQSLKSLSNMVYSTSANKYNPSNSKYNEINNTFSPNINNTLNQMKNNY